MDQFDVFQDIAERTGGDIYLGFVGPVRTGKSTLIKRFMDLLVIPNITSAAEQQRAIDELPQSGGGRTIMTAEPKFVPNEAVEVEVREGLQVNVRMVDCVGYTVKGALGYAEADGPRMVRTPWFEDEIPFEEAAELGTRKVIADHSTIGLVVTTDGSITDFPRESYIEAEGRVINELKVLQKPFLVIMNTSNPQGEAVQALARELEDQYGVTVLPINCARATQEDLLNVLEQVLYEFPVVEVNVELPQWVEELEPEQWLRQKLENSVQEAIGQVRRLRDIDLALEAMAEIDDVEQVRLKDMSMGTGVASIQMTVREGLFYEVVEETTGYRIDGEHTLLKLLRELAVAKHEWDKVGYGIQEARATGYGVISPALDEMELEDPEMFRQGGRFGVRLKATAPSYHLIKAEISTELTPVIGTEKQCEELVRYIMEEFEDKPQKIWDTNIFGKSLHELVREGIQGKLYRMPQNAQEKLQETLRRIVNEGSGGLICIII